jgi:hypothetical protein
MEHLGIELAKEIHEDAFGNDPKISLKFYPAAIVAQVSEYKRVFRICTHQNYEGFYFAIYSTPGPFADTLEDWLVANRYVNKFTELGADGETRWESPDYQLKTYKTTPA